MVDFTLQEPDFSPLFSLINRQDQLRREKAQTERANKLDQLAFQQFEETKKQNALASQRADFNASTNRINADANAARAEMDAEEHELTVQALRQELDAQQAELDQSRLKIGFSHIGPPMEAVIGALEAGAEIPEDAKKQLIEGLSFSEEMFKDGPFAQNITNLKNRSLRALETGSLEDWESAVGEAENLMRFAQSDNPQTELQQIQTERARIGLEADRESLSRSRQEAAQETQERTEQQTAGRRELETMLDTVNWLLEEGDFFGGDRRFERISGNLRPANPAFVLKPILNDEDKTINARLNNLRSMLSLENRSKLKGQGTISDFEGAQLDRAGSPLFNEKGIGEEGAEESLLELQKWLTDKLGVSSNFRLSPGATSTNIVNPEDF